MDPVTAESGRSVYFFGRMLGTFAGALLLTKISSRNLFLWTTVFGIASLGLLLVIQSNAMVWALVFLTGLAVANIFPLVFGISVEKYPDRSNEISGLMMMAISGGAVIPFLIGWVSDLTENVTAGMSVLILCLIYLLATSIYCVKKH
jgi:fucose permease